ncbi:MAG TPA: hypothetical protein VIH75_17630 [Candidatus Sulfotelmatobacter sp.]|jgi:hypothetical protein
MAEWSLARYRYAFALAAVLLLCGGSGSAQAASSEAHEIWKSSSDGFSIEWTKKDIVVTRANAPVLSFEAIAESDWNKISQPAADQPMQSARSYRILSAVGHFLSVEQEDDCDCGGAHPSSSKRFRAIDLSKSAPDRAASTSMTDIFPEGSILSALRGDKLVADALKNLEGPQPASLAELVAVIQFKSVQVKDCSYYFGADLLSDFAFYAVEGNKVAVRISLSHAAEVCRGQMTQLGILLPIPESLKTALEAARSGKSGILLQQANREFASAQTSITFATKGYGK